MKNIKNKLADYAKDIKLNLSTVLTEDGAPDLTQKQITMTALASAFASKNRELIDALLADNQEQLSTVEINGVKAAATIMAMNNIFYRFLHLTTDKSYSSLPAKLRMNVMASPGIEKIDFELCSLAVSAINGCGMCIDSHTQMLEKAGASKLGIQSAIRIASVIHAASFALELN
ncbi:MAG: carboxymuconolactone decarboxylase family protein [Gammaproteobacteria bacterium]